MLPRLSFHAPESLDRTFALLAEFGQDARLMAGGTDLLPRMRAGRLQASQLVSTRRLSDLSGVDVHQESGLTIGAAATLREVQSAISDHYPVLSEAISVLATPQVRNKATVAGNLCNASPCADTATPLMALHATVSIVRPEGSRNMTVEEFIKGPGKTALEPGELVQGLHVPRPDPKLKTFFAKLSPRSLVDISAVSVTLAIKLQDRTVESVDLILGTVAPRPMRATQAEDLLRGNELTDKLAEEAALAAQDECSPITDLRAKHEYKLRMVRVLTRRLLAKAVSST